MATQERRRSYTTRVWYRMDAEREVCHITDRIRVVRGPAQVPKKQYSYDVQLLHNDLWMPVSPILSCAGHAFRRAERIADRHARLEATA